jgi:hypothetical protein
MEAETGANWLDDFQGQHVTVLTQAGNEEKSETGTLLRIAAGWLQLVKDNGEMLLVPSTAIRAVKLLDMVHRTAAMERQPELDYPTRGYIAADTTARSHAPDDQAVI